MKRTQIFKKSTIKALLCALVLTMAGFVPTAAYADDAATLAQTIISYGLIAEVDNNTNTVTVTGFKTNATETLELDIDASVDVIWKTILYYTEQHNVIYQPKAPLPPQGSSGDANIQPYNNFITTL